MKNSIVFAFLSVLIGLLIFVFLFSAPEEQTVVDAHFSSVMSHKPCKCSVHYARMLPNGNIVSENRHMSTQQFVELITDHRDGCVTQGVHIHAHPDLSMQQVIDFTNSIEQALPDILIVWKSYEE